MRCIFHLTTLSVGRDNLSTHMTQQLKYHPWSTNEKHFLLNNSVCRVVTICLLVPVVKSIFPLVSCQQYWTWHDLSDCHLFEWQFWNFPLFYPPVSNMYVFYLFVHCLYYTTQSMQRTCSATMKLILVRKKVLYKTTVQKTSCTYSELEKIPRYETVSFIFLLFS